MITVPSALRTQFAACLHEQAIPQRAQAAYHKWLRYYWDFCHKYHFPPEHRDSLAHFLKKLQDKRQATAQQKQATHAIGLYYELLESRSSVSTPGPSQERNVVKGKAPAESSEKSDFASHQTRTGRGASWKAEYIRLAEILQSRNYAPKIVTAYTRWVRKFQAFTRSKAPESLLSKDARAFLAWLPTKRKMSFSQQNQVFESLLLFYKVVLSGH